MAVSEEFVADSVPGPTSLESVVGRLQVLLEGIDRLGVAFSGGVDSSVLAGLAVRAVGPARVVAILGVSASLAAADREQAHIAAAAIGLRLVEVHTRELQEPAYRENGVDRCFHCRTALFGHISDEVADRYGLQAIAYGEQADDRERPDRPGSRAAAAHGVLAPLADLGLRKADVRRLAIELGLPNAHRPAAPCLASRIPHHEPVTPGKLRQIEQAEAGLRLLGFIDLRVRHHGDSARIELPEVDLPRAMSEPLRGEIVRAVTAAGFDHVVVDPAGLRSGEFTLRALDVEQGRVPPTGQPPQPR